MAVQNSSKKWMLILGGVIAAVALVVGFRHYPPQPNDAAGAIGGAQRYQEPQITGDDVKVTQDEVTKWIQSDTFDRIVKDPVARKLFTDALVREAMIEASGARVTPEMAENSRNQSKNLAPIDGADLGAQKIQIADESGLDDNRAKKVMPIAGDFGRTQDKPNLAPTDGTDFDKSRELVADAPGLDNLKGLTPKTADLGRTQGKPSMVPTDGADLNKIQLAESAVLDRLSKLHPYMAPTDLAMVKTALKNDAIRKAVEDNEFCDALLKVTVSDKLVAYAREMAPLELD